MGYAWWEDESLIINKPEFPVAGTLAYAYDHMTSRWTVWKAVEFAVPCGPVSKLWTPPKEPASPVLRWRPQHIILCGDGRILECEQRC